MKRFMSKKLLVVGVVTALVLGIGGVAFAYFSATGSGTGTAQTGTASHLIISQVGAGYDSLIPTAPGNDPYIQDQCFSCASITEFGNSVQLASPGYSQLADVTVGFRNWGPAQSSEALTLNIYQPDSPENQASVSVGGDLLATDTQDFALPAAAGPSTPTAFDVTFNFSAQGVFVPQDIVYGITYGDAGGGEGGLNVALSNSANDVSVGNDAVTGDVFVEGSGPGLNGDAPLCANPNATQFAQLFIDCGTQNPGNPGAYGTPAEVAAGNGDIPAVEIDVVGGVAAPLSPGGPYEAVNYMVTNPGPSTAYLSTVTTHLPATIGSDGIGGDPVCTVAWYALTGATATANQNLAPGQSVFYLSTGTAVGMPADNVDIQNNCEGQTLALSFTSP